MKTQFMELNGHLCKFFNSMLVDGRVTQARVLEDGASL